MLCSLRNSLRYEYEELSSAVDATRSLLRYWRGRWWALFRWRRALFRWRWAFLKCRAYQPCSDNQRAYQPCCDNQRAYQPCTARNTRACDRSQAGYGSACYARDYQAYAMVDVLDSSCSYASSSICINTIGEEMKLTVAHYSKSHPDYDLSIIREVPREYASVVPDMAGATVLDIGGHIGCFSVLAINAGCKRVVFVEPGKPSVVHAKRNLAPAVKAGLAEVHHAGVTADPKEKEIILRYFTDAGSMAGAKTVKPDNTDRAHWRGKPYTYERVPALHFGQLLSDYKPEVLKLDCEGVEYPCLDSLKSMPKHVKVFIGEWHKTGGREGINGYLRCTERLREWGFKADREPNLVITYSEDSKPIKSNQFFIRPIAWRR